MMTEAFEQNKAWRMRFLSAQYGTSRSKCCESVVKTLIIEMESKQWASHALETDGNLSVVL